VTYDEMMQQLAAAQPARFSAPTFTAKALPSGAGLSAHDAALIKGMAPAIQEYVAEEIAKAVAPLRAEIAALKTLTASRPPAGERRGHGDARGPHSFEYSTNNYWRQ
jgi:hypothetical protein